MINVHSVIADFEKAQINSEKTIPPFRSGDSVVVAVKVKEGNRERIQNFEGVVIARRNRGFNSSFTVRKISYGEGVERVFPIISPLVEGVEIVRRGKVRRAKLYYLRGLTGKAARIVEKKDNRKGKAAVPVTGTAEKVTEETVAKAPAAE